MASKKASTIVILLISLATVLILTPLIYRKLTNYYISKEVKQRFQNQGEELPVIISLEGMIVSPGTNKSQLLDLKVGVQINPNQPELVYEINTKSTLINKRFQYLLKNYSVSQLRRISNKNVLKEEMKHEINGLLESGEINTVYFEKFLIISSD